MNSKVLIFIQLPLNCLFFFQLSLIQTKIENYNNLESANPVKMC